jgi:hypothetical protein
MNFQNQAIAVSNEQAEQKPEVDIRESARIDRGHVDTGYDDVKLASNNVDALMRRMSLSSTREIDSLIGELNACKGSERWRSGGTRGPRIHGSESVGDPADENHFRRSDTS